MSKIFKLFLILIIALAILSVSYIVEQRMVDERPVDGVAWSTYQFHNNIEPSFRLSFAYPQEYEVLVPCSSLTDIAVECPDGYPAIQLYKQGTKPDAQTLKESAEGGFAGGDIWVQWYEGDVALDQIIDPKQVDITTGQEKTYGENTGIEFTAVGSGSVNIFIFKNSGYTFEITDVYSNDLQYFPASDWARLLSSFKVE